MSEIYLESDIKQAKMSQLETGDLVKFQADITPIIFHYGIIERIGDDLFIYHNQATFTNKFGGGMVREDFKKYAKGRKVVSIEKTGLDGKQLREITDLLKTKRYHWVNNNCEHFVNKLKSNKFISPTVGKLALGLVVSAGIFWYLKKK